jgi:hypothetical protein
LGVVVRALGMHPTLARFLDVGKALALLDAPGGAAGDLDAGAFLQASSEDPGLTAQLKAAKGVDRPGPDAQQALVVLAVRAAVARLADDATLGPLAKAASDALLKEGATQADVTQMLGTVLLEEGFADENDPDTFDGEFVRETLASLPALAALDEDKVDALVEAFITSRPNQERPLALKAADAFLGEAWGDGLQPLTTEHAELSVEVMWSEGAEEDAPKLVQQLAHLLAFLEKSGLVGPARSKRLGEIARATLATLQSGGEDDDEEEDDDGDGGEPESGQPLN